MDNNFVNSFIYEALEPNFTQALMMYQSLRRKSKFLCFVESSVDKKFYYNFLYKKLSVLQNDVEYIPCRNKTNVLKIPQLLFEKFNVNFNQEHNHIFIVDLDYDHLPQNEYTSMISVLPCYSIENYLFYQGNLETILITSFNFSSYFYNKFLLSLKRFVQDILVYETLLRLKVQGYHNLDLYWEKEMLTRGTFDNDYYRLSDDFMSSCLSKKEQFLLLHPNNLIVFNQTYEELQASYQYIRGHDLEIFFNEFMNAKGLFKIKVYNILINEEIAEKLQIELKIAT